MKVKFAKLWLKINNKVLLKSMVGFVLFYLLCVANVNSGLIYPFTFGLYYSLMFLDDNKWGYFVSFVCAFVLSLPSLVGVFVGLNLAIVPLVMSHVHAKLNKKAHIAIICVYALLGNILNFYFNWLSAKAIILSITSFVVGIIFLCSCSHFLKATVFRGFRAKLNLDEIICGAVLVIAISCGVNFFTYFGFEFCKLLAVLIILICAYTQNSAIIIATIMGVGCSLNLLDVSYIVAFVCYALCSVAFKSNYKIIPAIAIILVEVVLGLLFNVYLRFNVLSVVAVIIAEIVFMLIPNKVLTRIETAFKANFNDVALRSIINRSKQNITKRMMQISNVFLEMDGVYKQMVQGVLPEADAKNMLKNELCQKCCYNCANKNKCSRVDGKFSTEVFNSLIDIGYEKGKVTLLDIPQYLTTKCGRVNYIISTLNSLLVSYKHYATMVNNMDASKTLIADQLKGVANLIKILAGEIDLNISFDIDTENKIKEELTYKNINCLEALVYEQNATIKHTNLIVSGDYNSEKLERVVSKIVGGKMKICNVENGVISGTKQVELKTSPNFDIVFGSAACSKTGVNISGDTHSLIKIDDGKYMVALCDGMGSGSNANKISDLTITLIENFYKAGFDNETILNSVNKLLTLNCDESFSALDVCVLDTRKNIMDFIKLGAPIGFIKHKFETETIKSSGLPIGVLNEMQPHVTKKLFSDLDIIVLVSDGISEAFEEKEDLQTFINNISSTNPQTIADEVLDRAVDLVNGNCTDDFTCVAVRIYPL